MSKAEFRAEFRALFPHALFEPLWAKVDTDGDGKLSKAGLDSPHERNMRRMGPRMDSRMDRWHRQRAPLLFSVVRSLPRPLKLHCHCRVTADIAVASVAPVEPAPQEGDAQGKAPDGGLEVPGVDRPNPRDARRGYGFKVRRVALRLLVVAA